MIVPIKMKDEDFEKIKTRTDDLIKFWSGWGYTDVETMPQYMQDIVKLIAHVEAIVKDGKDGDRIQKSQDTSIDPEIADTSKLSDGGVANTSTGIK